jgi:cytochrome P450
LIEENKATLNSDEARDYIDDFLVEQSKKGPDSTFTDLQLNVTMSDLFRAGGETTATTLRWAILLVSWHPEVQKKLHK